VNPWVQRILESKRAARAEIAALPFARKLELLEKLRDRSLLIASSSLRHPEQQHKREE
jgi:hypothetical protein